MKRLKIAMSLLGLLLARQSLAQSGAVIPQGGAGHAGQASCIILKRMGPADQITSHLYSFGIRGKQFQYVEGKLPDGFPFHGRLTDHDVRNLQGRGAEVIVVNQNYTSEELNQARADCRGETGKTPNQAEAKTVTSQTLTGTANPSTSAATPTGAMTEPPTAATSSAKLSIASNPGAADIEVDGSFVGNTPAEIEVAPGDHSLKVSKTGFKPWERKFKATVGHVNINAELVPEAR
jgi:PEGA domain